MLEIQFKIDSKSIDPRVEGLWRYPHVLLSNCFCELYPPFVANIAILVGWLPILLMNSKLLLPKALKIPLFAGYSFMLVGEIHMFADHTS